MREEGCTLVPYALKMEANWTPVAPPPTTIIDGHADGVELPYV
jgi:hypothetical protein